MKSKTIQIRFLRIILYENQPVQMKATECLNCSTHFKGNYCSHCGQKATVTKLTWGSLFEEIIHFFTHAEHSFIYTSRSLFTKPGIIVKEFLDGKRKKVHKPITFVLVWFAIYKLASAGFRYLATSLDLPRLVKTEATLGIHWTGAKNAVLVQNENFIMIILTAPLLAVMGWLVFRKTKTSFVERWVAILYGAAYTTIFSLFMIIFGFILRLLRVDTTTGFVNDVYFLIYYFSIAWFIYGFEKVYRPRLSKAQQIIIALLMSLVANYITDVLWYLLYWFVPA
jgi:hypothetical protein